MEMLQTDRLNLFLPLGRRLKPTVTNCHSAQILFRLLVRRRSYASRSQWLALQVSCTTCKSHRRRPRLHLSRWRLLNPNTLVPDLQLHLSHSSNPLPLLPHIKDRRLGRLHRGRESNRHRRRTGVSHTSRRHLARTTVVGRHRLPVRLVLQTLATMTARLPLWMTAAAG